MDSYDEEVRDFRDALRAVQHRLRRELAPARGLSRPAMQTLVTICRLPGTSAKGVAVELRMTSSNVAAALRELDEAGLLDRERDPDDSRRVRLSATADGESVAAQHRRERDSWLGQAIAAVLTEDERQQLFAAGRLMQRVADFETVGVR